MTAIEYLNSKMVSFFDKNIINIFRVPLCVSVLKKVVRVNREDCFK